LGGPMIKLSCWLGSITQISSLNGPVKAHKY